MLSKRNLYRYAVDPAAADACGMPAFGELSVVGVSAGRVVCSFA